MRGSADVRMRKNGRQWTEDGRADGQRACPVPERREWYRVRCSVELRAEDGRQRTVADA